MKAVVCERYGPPKVLRFADMKKPEPGSNEVLVEIHASSLNAYDWRMQRADPFLVRLMGGGLLKPKNIILGADMAGRVEAVGKDVTRFQPGDDVFADLSDHGSGGCADYVCAPEDAFAPKPAGITFEEAAAAPMAGVTALQGLRDKGRIQTGQKVAINGASGGVGTFAVQLAKALGAEVTAVCSTGKMEMARSIGADHVIDYTREDFTLNGQRYDLILAANGHYSILDYQRALSPGGTYVASGGAMSQVFQAMLLGPVISKFGQKRLCLVGGRPNTQDLIFIGELMEAGKVKPVIDRRYPLSKVPEALEYLYAGHALGKVVITRQ